MNLPDTNVLLNRARPILGHSGVTVFDRIEKNIIHVVLVMPIVANDMLPIAALPNATFTWDRSLAGFRSSTH